jgi:hypothetical protein
MPTHYQLVAKTNGAFLRVSLNDIPVFWHEALSARAVFEMLDPWIVEGENELRVQLAWPKSPSGTAGDPAAAEVAVEVRELTGPKEPYDARVIEQIVWPPPDPMQRERLIATAERRLRHEALARFSPAAVPPVELWSKARPIDLTPEVREKAIELVIGAQMAMDLYVFDRVLELTAFRNEDLARAYGVPHTRPRGELASQLLASLPDHALEGDAPIDLQADAQKNLDALVAEDLEQSLELHLIADRRLLWVTRPGLEPALRTRTSPRTEIPAYLALIDGQLTFAR